MTRIAILSVPVSDQQRAMEFYTRILGFTVVRDNPMGPDQRWVQLCPPGGGTSITLVTWFTSMPPGSLSGTVLETDDIKTDHHRLCEHGLAISALEDAPWGLYATFNDPDGNGWVLQQTSAKRE